MQKIVAVFILPLLLLFSFAIARNIFYLILPYALIGSLILLALTCSLIAFSIVYKIQNLIIFLLPPLFLLALSSTFFWWLDSYPKTEFLGNVCFPCNPKFLKSASYECSEGFNRISCHTKRRGEFLGHQYSKAEYYFDSRENRVVTLNFGKPKSNEPNLSDLIKKLEASGWQKKEDYKEIRKQNWSVDISTARFCGGPNGKKYICTDEKYTGDSVTHRHSGYSFTHADYKYPIQIKFQHTLWSINIKELQTMAYTVAIGENRFSPLEMENDETQTPVPSTASATPSSPVHSEACLSAYRKRRDAEAKIESSEEPSAESIKEINSAYVELDKNNCKNIK